MLHCVIRNMDKGCVSSEIIGRIINVFVRNNLTGEDQDCGIAAERFEEKYGKLPPTFIVLSPTQRCNLKCIGCYASSAADTSPTIPYDYVDRIVSEVHDLFGSRFITISGGEPLMYYSDGKTLFDIFDKYNNMLKLTDGQFENAKIKIAESAFRLR